VKPPAVRVYVGALAVLAALIPAVSQTQQGTAPPPPAPAKKAPENLPWTRFHPAAAPYQPTDAEKQQIQAKIDQLAKAIAALRTAQSNDSLLPDVEIYLEAARWKMAYPEEFFPAAIGDRHARSP